MLFLGIICVVFVSSSIVVFRLLARLAVSPLLVLCSTIFKSKQRMVELVQFYEILSSVIFTMNGKLH